MKNRIKLVFAVLCLSFLFSGCELLCSVGLCETDPIDEISEVKFSNYVVDGKKINTSTIQVVSGKSVEMNLTMNMKDKYYKWVIYKNGVIRHTSKCNSAENINKTVSIGTSGFAVGTEQYGEILLYTDSECTKKVKDTNYITRTVVVNSAPTTTSSVLKALGNDKTQICKSGFLDANNNETDIGTDNLFVRIAYSQIGYKEKKSGSKRENSCTADSGTADVQKYGPNGSAWCNYFIHWCLKKAGITSPFSTSATVSDIYSWASSNSRLYTSNSGRKTGDLVVLNNKSHIGILYQENNTWYIIHGNWTTNSQGYTGVYKTKLGNSTYGTSNITGYVNMDGYTY